MDNERSHAAKYPTHRRRYACISILPETIKVGGAPHGDAAQALTPPTRDARPQNQQRYLWHMGVTMTA